MQRDADGALNSKERAGERVDDPAIGAIEGKTVRLEGFLYPGDRYRATGLFVVDDHCREDLYRGCLLCDPCATQAGMPHKPLPQQRGSDVKLPLEVLRKYDDLNRWMRR